MPGSFAKEGDTHLESEEYVITWAVGGRELLTQRVTAVTGRRFIDSLRVSDARFVSADKAGSVKVARHPPPAGEAARVGPCFLLASREPGAAGAPDACTELLPQTRRALLHRLAVGQAEGRAPSMTGAVVRGGRAVWTGARGSVEGEAPHGDGQ